MPGPDSTVEDGWVGKESSKNNKASLIITVEISLPVMVAEGIVTAELPLGGDVQDTVKAR